jgi:hypothetical protein
MATSAERMRARERRRRGLRKLRIQVSEDDLRQIALAGYEGAASTDHDQQARPSACFSATRSCKSDSCRYSVRRDGVTSRDGVT